MTIKDSKHVKINSVNPFYLIFNKVNEYFEEINEKTYLTLFPNNENKKKYENMKSCGLKSKI